MKVSMPPVCYLLELLLLFILTAEAQLKVQIRRYEEAMWNLELYNSNNSYSVIADYSFPSGFSTDWFITSYANIPAEGIIGVLYQPQPADGCSAFNSSFQDDCSDQYSNLSRISLLEDYHLCTGQKIRSNQEASFDATITYSPGDKCMDIGQSIYDASSDETLDINASGLPLAVVSEKFYTELLVTATTRNCPADYIELVSLRVGSTNIGSVRSALIAFFVLCGLLIVTTQLMCCFLVYLICNKLFWRKRGRYDVHESHMHELQGLGDPRNTSRGAHILPYTPEEREFHRKEGDALTRCSICLEDFSEGEMITVLSCDRNHAFHQNCIDKWLNTQSTCPVCRTSTYSS